ICGYPGSTAASATISVTVARSAGACWISLHATSSIWRGSACMADTTTRARTRARLDEALARGRVPLGFAFGAAVVWLAHPTFFTLAIGGTIATLGELVRL